MRSFACVGWQVTLCDPIWQVMSRSSEVGFPRKSYIGLLLYFLNLIDQIADYERSHYVM